MNKKTTILYERLSREDSRADESLSIENQKKILEKYAAEMASRHSPISVMTARPEPTSIDPAGRS
ncbi:MAG: hypothetical protein LBU32_05990 [Clostridiales bacterium]|jgi:hypothetical protein|nr:hypothetical protein [Clostridiales bacterium]